MRKYFYAAAGVFLFVCLSIPDVFATRLVSYTFRGETRVGAWTDEYVVDLNRAYALLLKDRDTPRAEARADALVPPSMHVFLQGEGESMQAAMDALSFVRHRLKNEGSKDRLPEDGVLFSGTEVKLKAALPDAPHVLAIGLNYREHAAEMGLELPEYPMVFSKHGKVIGPGDTILIPAATQMPDYEAELGFVIGKRASRVPKEAALDYVAGYVVFNDLTARDVQRHSSQITLGKSPDTFSAMGPYLVLKDEVADPHKLRITTRIGNDVLQDANTGDMIFTVSDLIAYITQVLTLEPGTVVTTGTPSGVGMARSRFLKPGETVVVEIEKIGRLSNPVAKE